MRRLQYKYCEPYTAAFRRYLRQKAHISIPKELLYHFTALEQQRVRQGYIQAAFETDHPLFRPMLVHYLNYLNEYVHFSNYPVAHVYSHLKDDARQFVDQIRHSHAEVRPYCARSPYGCRGATANYAIWLNAHGFTKQSFYATMRSLFGTIDCSEGNLLIVHTFPTRRHHVRHFLNHYAHPDNISSIGHLSPPPRPHRYKYPIIPKEYRPVRRKRPPRPKLPERLQQFLYWMPPPVGIDVKPQPVDNPSQVGIPPRETHNPNPCRIFYSTPPSTHSPLLSLWNRFSRHSTLDPGHSILSTLAPRHWTLSTKIPSYAVG